MSGITSVRSTTNSSLLSSLGPEGASGPETQARARRVEGGVEIRWGVAASAAFACVGEARAAVEIEVSGRGRVPVRLEVLDGPSIRLVYEDRRLPPGDFAEFCALVSGPGLERREMGGSTTPEGFFAFQSGVLGDGVWAQGGSAEILVELRGV